MKSTKMFVVLKPSSLLPRVYVWKRSGVDFIYYAFMPEIFVIEMISLLQALVFLKFLARDGQFENGFLYT